MRQFLQRVLNIQPSEVPQVLVLFVMLMLYVLGWFWGVSIVEAAFLDTLGAVALPLFFVMRGVLSVPVLAGYTLIADRVPNQHILLLILGLGAAVVGGGVLLLLLDMAWVAFPILYLNLLILDDVFATHWYTYASEFFDTRSAKRLLPVIIAAAMVGTVTAGLTVPLLAAWLAPAWIVLVWLLSMLLVMGLAVWQARSGRTRRERVPASNSNAASQEPYMETLREGYAYVRGSVLLRWMALGSLLVMIILILLEYVTSQFLLARLQTTEAIASFTGPVIALGSLVMLPVQLFLLGRIISRIGVGNAVMIFPLGNLVLSAAFLGMPSLPTAGLAYASRNNVYPVSFTITNLLYNAVPVRVQGRARAFTSGLLLPAGAVIGGGMLVIAQHFGWAWVAPTALLLLGAAYVVVNWLIRRSYTSALLATLEEDDLSLQLAQLASEPGFVDPTLLALLKQKFDETTTPRSAIFVASLIHQIGGNDAVPLLRNAALRTGSAEVRAAILTMLGDAGRNNAQVRKLYMTCLQDASAEVRLTALQVLQQVARGDALLVQSAEGLLDDASAAVQGQALTILLDLPQARPRALEQVQAMLAADEPELRERAVQVLGQTRNAYYLHWLLPALDDPADNVRLRAAVACEQVLAGTLTTAALSDLLSQISQRVDDPLERVRLAVLLVLGYAGDAASLPLLVRMLSDTSPLVRATAADVLACLGSGELLSTAAFTMPLEYGDLHLQQHRASLQQMRELAPRVVAALQQAQQTPDPLQRTMAIVVLTRINRERYRASLLAQIEATVQRIYQLRLYHQALAPLADQPAFAAVQATLYEQGQVLLDEVFYMLSALSDPRSIRLVQESLQSSLIHVRANATEALETIASPHLACLIEPLGTGSATAEQIVAGARQAGLTSPTLAATLTHLVQHADAWQRAATVYALQQARAPAPAPATPPATVEHADTDDTPANRRKRRLANLLEQVQQPAPPPAPATLPPVLAPQQVEHWLTLAQQPSDTVRNAQALLPAGDGVLLTLVERVLLLRGVPFFEGMTIAQLRVLAAVCKERAYHAEELVFQAGDPAQSLYIVVRGQVRIEQEKRRGQYTTLATATAGDAFGEASLFDPNPHSTRAVATTPTLLLILSRDPLIALASQNVTVLLAMMTVMSQRLRDAQMRIADLTRAQPRQLQRLYDMLS